MLSQELQFKSRVAWIFTQIRAQFGMKIKQDVWMISLVFTILIITPIYIAFQHIWPLEVIRGVKMTFGEFRKLAVGCSDRSSWLECVQVGFARKTAISVDLRHDSVD